MRLIVIIILFVGLISNSCNRPDSNYNIHSIWVGAYHQVLYFDSTKSLYNYLPMIIDLTDSSQAIIKEFTSKKTSKAWEINDSILMIDSINYRIISISKDSIAYSPYLKENEKPKEEPVDENILTVVPIRDEYYVLRRVKENKLKYSDTEISHILNNRLCKKTSIDSTILNYENWIEFLDNGVAISKTIDSARNIYLYDDCWKVENYQGYTFLVFYHNWYQNNGWMDYGFQILDLTKNGLTLNESSENISVLYNFTKVNERNTNESQLIGKWISINDTAKYYSRRLPVEAIQRGTLKLFNDTLIYQFHEDLLTISGKGFESINCNWRLNYDSSILIFEYLIDLEEFYGFHVQYANLKNFTNSSFEIELFENRIFTKLKKPRKLILNRNQIFRKVE